jgi:hypothetical protein
MDAMFLTHLVNKKLKIHFNFVNLVFSEKKIKSYESLKTFITQICTLLSNVSSSQQLP